MRKILNNQLTKLIKITLGLGLLLCAFVAIYIFQTISELQIYLEDEPPKMTKEREFKIENDSLIGKREFRFFNTFLQKSIKKEKLDDYFTSFDRTKNLVKNDLVYGSLLANHCKQIYCFQNKLPFEKIPSNFWKGLIGIEDTRFLDHIGIDVISIIRAIVADIKAMKLVQGGSTITQQLAKNLFLSNEKTFSRKFKEWIYAIYLEKKYLKEDILKLYFNEMEWGSLNSTKIKGVNAASLFYFVKKPEDLSPYEATILITMLKGPYYYHPINKTERLRKRVDNDFKKLVKKNVFLSLESQWNDSDWEKWVKDLKTYVDSNFYRSIWFASKNLNSLLEPFQVFIFDQSTNTTLKRLREKYKIKELAFKSIIIEPECKSKCASYYFYSSYERKLNEAIEEEKHQVGSILKPILYNMYIDEGFEWDDQISTAPITLKLVSGKWTPKEASRIKNDKITVEEALMRSRNIPTIKLANDIGFEKIEERLEKYIPEIKKPLKEYPAQLLGAIELSLKQISEIYKKFIIEKCHISQKTSLLVLSDPSKTTLRNVVAKPIKESKFFGKTGTSNSGLDSWFVGFDGKYLSINWFGVDGNRLNKKLRIGGATSSFRIYQNYLLKNGKRPGSFNCNL